MLKVNQKKNLNTERFMITGNLKNNFNWYVFVAEKNNSQKTCKGTNITHYCKILDKEKTMEIWLQKNFQLLKSLLIYSKKDFLRHNLKPLLQILS